MTTRAGKPDTEADVLLRECLDGDAPASFVMVAGAGSGKTTSLVKALDHLGRTRGARLRRNGQKVACITYTEVAVREIRDDVGEDPLFHVSTIHSFLWSAIRPFQSDIRRWVSGRIADKIADLEAKADNPRAKPATAERRRREADGLRSVARRIASVDRFTYGTGSDYAAGVLGHSDVLDMVPNLILEHALLRTLVALRHPFVFVDESQDTDPDVVEAFKSIDRQESGRFCLGFFGDPMQKIYAAGAGDVVAEAGWRRIEKPENFRCPSQVLDVINRIRETGDGLRQTGGRRRTVEGRDGAVEGSARLFVMPADGRRDERLRALRTHVATLTQDGGWCDAEQGGDVRLLVIVHRMAAARLGFAALYAALHDGAPASLKDGLLEGTAWPVRPFLDYLLPLAEAGPRGGRRTIALLKANCPRLSRERLEGADVAASLETLANDVVTLERLLASSGDASVGDVLRFVRDAELADFDDRFEPYLTGDAPGEDPALDAAMAAFLDCRAREFIGYRSYVQNQSPFATQQGVKGAEFDRVLVVIDEEEGRHSHFSYDRYWGLAPPTNADAKSALEGRDTSIDRTRRLFYVCCSRAGRDLVVALFARDVDRAVEAVSNSGIFAADDVSVFDLVD
ncbi:UvrD-helicase domain-containing protein [Caenispirillum salinarum]|uniref:UvrD-helicase domain-containing protein n=1 Tax=Caenispirillum salinarum TaxID=859058 RepID=UPI00384EAD07